MDLVSAVSPDHGAEPFRENDCHRDFDYYHFRYFRHLVENIADGVNISNGGSGRNYKDDRGYYDEP